MSLKPTINRETTIVYRANESPKWWLAILLGLQQVMESVSGFLVTPYQVSQFLCAGSATAAIRVQLISTTFVASGLITILQVACGLRLSLMQGPSTAFLAPLIAFARLPEFACTNGPDADVPASEYLPRLQILQGSLVCASLSIVLLGATGLSGVVTRHIGPITVAPLLVLLELSVVQSCLEQMQTHWVSIIQFLVLLLFAGYLADVDVPCPLFHNGKLTFKHFRLFGRFPFLLGLGIVWFVCFILTITNIEQPGSAARTDSNHSFEALKHSPWFYLPYPGQFGPLQFNAGLFLGFLAACVICVIESLGNYQVIAIASQERPPPSSAINRGMLFEGIGCAIAGLLGVGIGVTTYSNNIALIPLTRVASRMTLEIAGVIMILMGVFTKFGAFMGTIPDPLMGAIFAFGMTMVAGVALSTLQEVNLRQTRNVNILGIALLLGMLVPLYSASHSFKTGIHDLDSMLNVVLRIPMLVGGFVAFVLDNTIPGATLEDRGLIGRRDSMRTVVPVGLDDGYAFPAYIERILDRIPLARRLPIFADKCESPEAADERRPDASIDNKLTSFSEDHLVLKRLARSISEDPRLAHRKYSQITTAF